MACTHTYIECKYFMTAESEMLQFDRNIYNIFAA